jgi:hypothetical protein
MKSLIFILILLITGSLSSQEDLTQIDSLKNEIWTLEQRLNTMEVLFIASSGNEVDSLIGIEIDGRKPAMAGTELITYAYDEANQTSLINHSFWLSLAILVFGILIIGGAILIMIRQNKGWGPNAIQIVGIVLIVVSSLFLITAGYSESQITPAIGLLGTIAGYLLGKTSNEKN